MRYVLILLGLMFANAAEAMDCQKLQDCASLGYLKDNDPNCADDGYMYCPFDQDYKVCVQYNCAALGFTESDKSSWCADLIKCKGNPRMTLCQKPCFATDAQSLAELASSGHCKIVTIRNDITIPENESITLAENTLIDGGSHTLRSSSNQSSHTTLYLNNKTGMKNLKIQHTQTETQKYFNLLKALSRSNAVSLENIDISVSSSDTGDHATTIIGAGTYNISGKFALDVQMKNHLAALEPSGTYYFENAQVSMNIVGISGDMAMTSSKTTFVNSTINANIQGYFLTNGASVTLKNSKANLKGNLFWSVLGGPHLILEESSMTLDLNIINYGGTPDITLKGTTEHPSVLDMRFTHAETGSAYTNIITTNTTDTFVLGGVTYRPKQLATTKLSEIEKSGNWIKE